MDVAKWDLGLWSLVGGSDLSSPTVYEPHLTPDHGVVASHGSGKVVLDQGVVRLLVLDLPGTRTRRIYTGADPGGGGGSNEPPHFSDYGIHVFCSGRTGRPPMPWCQN